MPNEEIEEQADKYANEKVAEIRTGKNSYSTLQMWCDRASGFVDGAKWGIETICKKILEEMYDYSYPAYDPITNEDGPCVVELSDLKEIIKKLGVEI